MPGKLQTILGLIAQQVTDEFDFAKSIQHSGESGRAREAMLRTFLERVMPMDFGIDTGFVLDAANGISKQIDIVVYRKSRAPILEVGGIKHFMVESVAAVIEVKATIGGTKVLTAALDNVASAKRLDRTGQGRNTWAHSNMPILGDHLQGQLFGAVIAGRSLTAARMRDTIIGWQRGRPRSEWINEYVDLRGYMIKQLETDSAGDLHSSIDPNIASGIAPVDTSKHDGASIPTLAMFAVSLLEVLSITPEIDYRKAGYFVRDVIARVDQPYEYDDSFEDRAPYGDWMT